MHYLQDRFVEPDIIIDISEVFEQRMNAIKAYTTQFHNTDAIDSEPQTYISTPDFFDAIVARARLLGKRIGVKYAEGFISEKKIGIRSLDALVSVET